MKMEEFNGLWFKPNEIRLIKVSPPSCLDTDGRWRLYLELHSGSISSGHPAWTMAKYTSEQEARDAAKKLAELHDNAIENMERRT